MKCIRCNRPLKEAAVKIGSFWYGPVCAEKSGLLEKKKRRRKRVVSNVVQDYDPRQMWLDLKD